MKNEKGATYKLNNKTTASKYRESQHSKLPQKYLTLNQVNVNIAGGHDKLLVIRDVSHMVFLENILETKSQMNLFTDELLKQIEGYGIVSSQGLERLDQYIEHQGKTLADDSQNEIQKCC